MTEQFVKMSNRNQEQRRHSSQTTGTQPSRKQPRKGGNPVRLPSAAGLTQDEESSNTRICKNSACRAVLSLDDIFCKRCSCCICHSFDDNKDPSLWLVCTSEFDKGDTCGLSCHIECAILRQKVGVVDLGQLMQLDGTYCCASCGKVTEILGCWKKQFIIAKEARRVDVLCYRISLCYRLLDGTSRFKELHKVVSDAKAKLETEVGPISGDSAKMARGIVSRLSVAADVQNLCSLAIEKVDARLNSISTANFNHRENSLGAAFIFLFEEVTASSLVLVLDEPDASPSDAVKGYMLWYCPSREEPSSKEPMRIFPRTQKRVLISNLQPGIEYLFRIIPYTDSGSLGHFEAKCFTRNVEINHKNFESEVVVPQNEISPDNERLDTRNETVPRTSSFKVQDLGKVLYLTSAEEQGSLEGLCSADVEECSGGSSAMRYETPEDEKPMPNSRELDLNVVSVPDLNAELTPPLESSRDEDNECTLEQVVEAEDDAVSHGLEKNDQSRSSGSHDSQTCKIRAIREVPAVESRTELCRKQTLSSKSEAYDCVSTLINGSPLQVCAGSGYLDRSYEYCVKIIRWLECEGHIGQEFRMKFLTWFSLRSTEQERRVVHAFIQTLIEDPSSLAGQLIDSFSDIVKSKRTRNGFCSELWH